MRKQSMAMILGALVSFALGTVPARGQAEISGSAGGAWVSNRGGRQSTFGATAGIFTGSHLQVFGEYMRVPVASEHTTIPGGQPFDFTARYDDLGVGLLIRFFPGRRVQPYLLAPLVGAGFRTTYSSIPPNDTSRTDMYLGVGGGVRIIAGQHFGFKAEYRAQGWFNPEDILWSNTPDARIITGGVFFQFGER